MNRRECITVLGGVAATAAWPLAARGQQPASPVIGLLQSGAPGSWDLTGLRVGLKDAGFVEGQNLAIEYRWANDVPGRLPELAGDLVRRQVSLIAALGSPNAALAAKTATTAIPIIFGFGGDPVQQGLVATFNRPGGNVTGVTSQSTALAGKQLGLLHELLPQAGNFGILVNPGNPAANEIIRQAEAAASAINVTIRVLNASSSDEIDAAFSRAADAGRAQGLLVSPDSLFLENGVQLAVLAARYAVPAIYPFHEQTRAGGLLSYGPDLVERDRQVGRYVGRVLRGEKAADLPVAQSSKFELVINLKTAKALGLTVPYSLQLLADEVIE